VSRRLTLRWGGKTVEAEVAFQAGAATLSRDGRSLRAAYVREAGSVAFTLDGATCRAAVAKNARGLWVSFRGRTWVLTPEGREGAGRAAAELPDEIRAPMTGRVIALAAKADMSVKEGDLLLTLEAMKMEFKLTAPEDMRLPRTSTQASPLSAAAIL